MFDKQKLVTGPSNYNVANWGWVILGGKFIDLFGLEDTLFYWPTMACMTNALWYCMLKLYPKEMTNPIKWLHVNQVGIETVNWVVGKLIPVTDYKICDRLGIYFCIMHIFLLFFQVNSRFVRDLIRKM